MSDNIKQELKFNLSNGKLQQTHNGKMIYVNKNSAGGKVVAGVSDFANLNMQPIRENTNFPQNPYGMSETVFYHCLHHDYIFYPADFIDTQGVHRKSGYYDEQGNYYKELHIHHKPNDKGIVCKYCGHNAVVNLNEESLKNIVCPSCGAPLDYVEAVSLDRDYLVNSEDISKVTKAASTRPLVQDAQVKSSSVQRSAYDPGFDADGGTEFDPKLDLREDDSFIDSVWDSIVENGSESAEYSMRRREHVSAESAFISVGIIGFLLLILLPILFLSGLFR